MSSNHYVITRTQIGQALECAYIKTKELEEVIDNIQKLLEIAWEQGSLDRADRGLGIADNPYKESE